MILCLLIWYCDDNRDICLLKAQLSKKGTVPVLCKTKIDVLFSYEKVSINLLNERFLVNPESQQVTHSQIPVQSVHLLAKGSLQFSAIIIFQPCSYSDESGVMLKLTSELFYTGTELVQNICQDLIYALLKDVIIIIENLCRPRNLYQCFLSVTCAPRRTLTSLYKSNQTHGFQLQ